MAVQGGEMKAATVRWVGTCGAIVGLLCSWASYSWAGKLEDYLLENKQLTVEQWTHLKADEEKRKANQLEEGRVGGEPARRPWYERTTIGGYAQFRYNNTIDNDLLRSNQGDRSISGYNEFFLRTVRLALSFQPHDRIFIYIQPELASRSSEFAGPANVEHMSMLRDAYADLFLAEKKDWRLRFGLSPVPFGFDNMQSVQNRLSLDRSDAINSATPNVRDLGVFLYYSPSHIRQRFRQLVNSGLTGAGDFGIFGLGIYNGQGINVRDLNKDVHVVFHSTYPYEFANGQVVQVGMDAYTGQFNVGTTPVVPNLAAANGEAFLPRVTNGGNYLDERVTWSLVVFPQPFGFQAEYTIGRGPELNQDRTEVVSGSLRGGYMQAFYRYQCDSYCQDIFPFFRVQEYFGGRKAELNAPRNSVREWEIGTKYQLHRALAFTISYSWTQRNTPDSDFIPAGNPPGVCGVAGSGFGPCVQTPYQLQSGNLLRFQVQWNF